MTLDNDAKRMAAIAKLPTLFDAVEGHIKRYGAFRPVAALLSVGFAMYVAVWSVKEIARVVRIESTNHRQDAIIHRLQRATIDEIK